jgi:hypothetical protein
MCDSYESSFELDMQYFQEQIEDPTPLFIKEYYHEEMKHPWPVEDTE